MPADDHPFDALAKQFQREGAAISPVTEAVLQFVSLVPLPWPFDKATEALREHVSKDSFEKIRLMLETCMNQVRRLEADIGQIRAIVTESQHREEVSRDLLLDAARRAENTRSKKRVRRIGLILANSLVEAKPTDADEIEEMMRVASDLSDQDVKFLRELIRIEGDLLQTRDHIPRYDAHMKWESGFWGSRVDTEIDSVFSKLESYGLVARIASPSNLNILADHQNRYVLLMKGARFAALVRDAAVSS